MTTTLVRVAFENFEEWKRVFEESAELRRAFGSQGVRIFRNADEPNEAIVIAEYESPDQARQLFQSSEYREAISRAGVTGRPEVVFLSFVEELVA